MTTTPVRTAQGVLSGWLLGDAARATTAWRELVEAFGETEAEQLVFAVVCMQYAPAQDSNRRLEQVIGFVKRAEYFGRAEADEEEDESGR